jgi:predicted nucleotidyltransferase component of viral defense system
MSKVKYVAHVDLMLKALPHIANEKCFSLKGGTAINLFVRNMPRMSVDIDLVYVGRESRDQAIKTAEVALGNIKVAIERHDSRTKVLRPTKSDADNIGKLLIVNGGIQIKIEVNPVIRGTVFSSEDRDLVKNAEVQFGVALSVPVVSIPDLYGGKIVAALDRQHPRDIFDVRLLLENEGLTSDIMKGFVVYLSSHKRPVHEVISPTKKNMKSVFTEEFVGMTNIDFSYMDFEITRDVLISEVHSKLSVKHKKFLVSLTEGAPNWEFLELSGVRELPAVKWKLENIQKMKATKRNEAIVRLREILKTS